MISRLKNLSVLVFLLAWSCAASAQGSRLFVQKGSLPATANLVFEGDSITLGLFCNAPLNYPTRAILQLPAGPTYTNDTIATSGISSLTLDQNYATRAGAAFNAGSGLNILMFMAGTNTSGSTDTNAGQKYGLNRDYLRKARNTGYQRIVVGTVTARGDNNAFMLSTLGPLNQAQRAYYNSDMQADALMDWGNSQFFWPALAALDQTIYNTDFLHPIPLGCQQMANIAAPQIAGALQVSSARTFAPATWSPFTNSTNGNGGSDGTTALSTDFRTASVPTGSANYGIRGFPGFNSSKLYWENTITAFSNAVVVGVCNDYFLFNNSVLPGRDVAGNSIGYASDGTIRYGNSTLITIATIQTGDIVGTAFDFPNRLYWTRRCRSGACQSWNGNASADPATGIGGINLPGMQINGAGDRFYPVGAVFTSTDAIVTNFARSQMSFSPPSGYKTFGP